MPRCTRYSLLTTLLLALSAPATAGPPSSPWGRASATPVEYQGQKVVYDVSVDSERKLNGVLDRASYLSKITGANPFDTSIVLVLHGREIPFFAIKNMEKHKDLMVRAQSLTVGEVIKFRICRVAAEMQGFKPEDFHGFVELVPMADAEIVRLQQTEGHAYMR